MKIVGEYDLQSLQIYFNGSLEIQEELIRLGFHVPLVTPLPIIYGDYGGYESGVSVRGVLKPAALHPNRYGKTLEEMGWVELTDRFDLPEEYAKLKLSLETKPRGYNLHLIPQFLENKPGYHLEKASYRTAANQEKWRNWAMLYTSVDDLISIVDDLSGAIDFPKKLCFSPMFISHEVLGKAGRCEDTYYVSFDEKKAGIKQISYSLCLGCYKFALDYLQFEAEAYSTRGISKPAYQHAKLRLVDSSDIPVVMKLGLAKVEEKKPQFMIKLATYPEALKSIIGVGKGGETIMVRGKPRGNLIFCDHIKRTNKIVIDAHLFLRAACCARRFYFGMDGPIKDRNCSLCFSTRLLPAEWFPARDIQRQLTLERF